MVIDAVHLSLFSACFRRPVRSTQSGVSQSLHIPLRMRRTRGAGVRPGGRGSYLLVVHHNGSSNQFVTA
ncbi:hypothetical protein W823_06950 [Williamsia sp. D3]|nr:hypothetical protein W823_06950 [Williamsia sp. D3]